MPAEPYYRSDLALIHHRGFGFHADACAPGVIEVLQPVLARGGTVLELGCGSGLLTRHLLAAGHRVVATDASQAMLDLAADTAPGAELRRIVLPDDPLPAADAVVSVGHVLNYLPSAAAIDRALVAIAGALRPGGLLAIDLCDVRYGEARDGDPPRTWVTDDWALITEFSRPAADAFRRTMTMFVRTADGTWRRSDEVHDNVLLDTPQVVPLLARHGVGAWIGSSFGGETQPDGLVTVIGARD